MWLNIRRDCVPLTVQHPSLATASANTNFLFHKKWRGCAHVPTMYELCGTAARSFAFSADMKRCPTKPALRKQSCFLSFNAFQSARRALKKPFIVRAREKQQGARLTPNNNNVTTPTLSPTSRAVQAPWCKPEQACVFARSARVWGEVRSVGRGLYGLSKHPLRAPGANK